MYIHQFGVLNAACSMGHFDLAKEIISMTGKELMMQKPEGEVSMLVCMCVCACVSVGK